MKRLKKTTAQVVGEYIVVMTLVVVTAIAMTIFLRRLFQGRLRDASLYMTNIASTASANGAIPFAYEPYYLEQTSDVTRESNNDMQLLPGGKTGIFRKIYDEKTSVNTQSTQHPPKDAY